jgi:hypothetical protein
MYITHFNVAQTLTLLRTVVEDAGADHKALAEDGSTGCTYVEKNSDPHGRLVSVCIVGRLFDYLGILRAVRTDSGGQWDACILSSTLWVNAETMGVTFSDEAKELLRLIQSEQDGGHAWGDAMRRGMEEYVRQVEREAREAIGANSYWWRDAASAFPATDAD